MSKLAYCLRKYLCCGKNIICKRLLFKKHKINPILYSRIGYIVLFLLAIVYSVTLIITEDSILTGFHNSLECLEKSKETFYSCLEISSIYRLSFAFILLHLGCFCISLTNNRKMKVIAQNELWLLKILMLAIIYYSSLYVSNRIFYLFAYAAKYISVLYLLYQLILNVYFAHVLNFKLVYGFDNFKAKNRYKNSIIAFTLIFFLISIYFLVLSLFNFDNSWYNFAAVVGNIAFGLINIYISISDLVEEKRLLTSICIFSYSCYVTWAALNSQPYKNLNQSGSELVKEGQNLTLISNLVSGFANNGFAFLIGKNNSQVNYENFTTAISNNTSNANGFFNYTNGIFMINNLNRTMVEEDYTNDSTLILDFSESFFGLIYVLLSLIFVGFFSKKSYYGYNPFGSESETNSQMTLSVISNEDCNKREQEILETCNTLALEVQFRHSEECLEEDIINEDKSESYFHMFMILLSFYMSMLLSNWTIIHVDKDFKNSTFAWSSYFIKILIMILTHLIYLFLLICHRVFPERRFV